MLQIPENVLQALIQLVPASVLDEIICYVFYDNHPRDEKQIDIIVCTRMGEVREYYNRDLLSSISLDRIAEASEIKIIRNSKCELFYLVAVGDDLTILSRKDTLYIHYKLTQVLKYEVTDDVCSGQAVLKVETKYSDGLLVADDNFENFKYSEYMLPYNIGSVDFESSTIKHLMAKVTESRHTAESIKQTYKNFLEIRNKIAFTIYKKMHPNLDDSIFKDDPAMLATSSKIRIEKPWIRTCNKKIVIAYNICNNNQEALEDIQIFLHGTMRASMEYTTKIFEKTMAPPFWRETYLQILKPDMDSALVVVMDLKEMKYNILSKVEFNGVMIYKKSHFECTLPIEDVNLSALDTMAEQFDALSTDTMDDNLSLAILASTEKIDLIMRHITQESYTNDSSDPMTMDIFYKHLQMDMLPNSDNIAIFKKSPYHVLNGVMIILNEKGTDHLEVTVYSRTSDQVLALIHVIHDVVPCKIVTTTPTYKITAKSPNLSIKEPDAMPDLLPAYNYKGYATSILNRTIMVLHYLDNCMIQMSESKNLEFRKKLGKEIDLFGQGEVPYKEFKEKMWAEATKGIKMLKDVLVPELLSLYDVNMGVSNQSL